MIAAMRTYTPAEAAAVSEIAVKAVHNAIDKKIVETVVRPAPHGARMSRRALTGDGLLRLKLWYGVGATLAAERRQRLVRCHQGRAARPKPSRQMTC